MEWKNIINWPTEKEKLRSPGNIIWYIRSVSGAIFMVLTSLQAASANDCRLVTQELSISHENDINLINGDTNDSWLTGSIDARIDAAFCDTPITIEWNLDIWTSGWVDGAEDTQRVDVLELYLGSKEQIWRIIWFDVTRELWVGVSAVGNFWWDFLQEWIHSLTGNSQETANYTGKWYGITPFLRWSVEATKTIDIDNPLFSSAFLSGEIGWQLPLLQKFGTTEAYAEVQAWVNLPYGITPYAGYHIVYKDFAHNPVIENRIDATDIEKYMIVGINWDIQNFNRKPTWFQIDVKWKFWDVNGEKSNDSANLVLTRKF